jgi:hypothetical protein
MTVNTDQKYANDRSLLAQLGYLFGADFEMYTYLHFDTVKVKW